MPPRLARSSVQTALPKTARNKNKKRNLNAYAIASHSAPSKSKSKHSVKQHRLGEFLDDRPAPKRRRDSEDDDVAALDDEDLRGEAKRQKKTFDDGDIEEGSDSEGNEWTLGGLAEDDEDSDLDSEEAFGSSDEERFEGFTFRGSKSQKKPVKRKVRRDEGVVNGSVGVNLDENGGESAEDEEEDDFGEVGVDLATMLDDEDGEEADAADDDDSGVDEDMSASESDSGDDNEDEGDDEERNARVRDRLDALDGDQQVAKPQQTAQQNSLSVDDLLADLDPSAKKQFAAATKTRKRADRPTTLAAPLPKRQQDRLNREVASQKAKEQLDRWRDTVIQNRRAEFLSFPLKNPDQGEPQGKDKFLESKPQNELEANIQRIMEESGMGSKDGQNGAEDEEGAIMKAEGMAEQKMDVDEVMRRRAELRKTRELLFYEERKAKRIAKIKSKSYRRVHRKEKARQAVRDREEREEMGLGALDEEEREKQERRRAEERMGTKHRESKWAKQLKQTGRATWDEGARESVNEEARRREELRRRVEGRGVGSDEEDDDAGDEEEGDDDDEAFTLRRLDGLKRGEDAGQERQGLAGMKFMQDADARRRAQNDEDVERMRKELAIADGDEAESDDDGIDDQGLGRAIFGPQGREGKVKKKDKAKRPELEEGSASEGEEGREGEEEEGDVEIVTERKGREGKGQKSSLSKKGNGVGSGSLARANGRDPYGSATAPGDESVEQSWFAGRKKGAKQGQTTDDEPTARPDQQATVLDQEEPREKEKLRVKPARPDAPGFLQEMREQADKSPSTTTGVIPSGAADTEGKTLLKYANDADSDSDSETNDEPLLTPAAARNALHRKQAFAGDDVVAQFEAEKHAQEESEDEKETSSHLPGWGSWTGANLSRSVKKANAKARHNPLFKTKSPHGVKKSERQDAKLPNVIVSEKELGGVGMKKGRRFLAAQVPQGFGGKEEYERSLRRPIGGEWGTKEVVQRNVRPRVVVKRGVVVEAMERPLV